MGLFTITFQRFVSGLSESMDTRAFFSRNFEALASELLVGRVTVSMPVPAVWFFTKELDTTQVLHDGGCPCDDGNLYRKIVLTEDEKEAEFSVSPVQGAKAWSEEERSEIDILLEITGIHLGRYRLGEQVRHSAMTNYLTGYPNSGGYLREASKILARGCIGNYTAFYFNLKGTSIINLRFGQAEGDQIIKRYADALYETLMPDELLGHLGGDNFVALVRKDRSEAFIRRLAGIEVPAIQDGNRMTVLVSATAGLMQVHAQLPGIWMLISGPSIAWLQAKREGQNVVTLSERLIEQTNRARLVENTFYDALKAGEFVPFYQPKVDMQTGRIVGVEVLTRWVRDGHVISPGDFIPILERTEEIADLDLYILDQACRDISAWRKAGHLTVPMSVNISRRDIAIPGIAERIEACYEKYDIKEGDLLIEITESTNERESSLMRKFVYDLLSANIRTSVDDFGTGYSSFNFLRQLPVQELKIDRSFINHPLLDQKDRVIIGSIIDMARNLNIDVISEGVETKEQADFLINLGCRRAQGFLYDRPMPREKFEERLLMGSYDV